MKFKLFIALALVASLFSSCNKENCEVDTPFTIIGKWGMVSGTITDKNGQTTRYDEYEGMYYQYMEFLADGTLIRTTLPDNSKLYGVYTYNDALKALEYKFDDEMYYVSASINVLSAKEMNMTTNYGTAGRITQYFKKLSR